MRFCIPLTFGSFKNSEVTVLDNNCKTVQQNLQEMAGAKDYGEVEGIFHSLLEIYQSTLPELAGLLEESFPCFFRYTDRADFCWKLYSTLWPLSEFRKSIKEIVLDAAEDNASGLGTKIMSYLSSRNDELAKKIRRHAKMKAGKSEENRNAQKTQAAGQEEPSANDYITDSININGFEIPSVLLDLETLQKLIEGISMS